MSTKILKNRKSSLTSGFKPLGQGIVEDFHMRLRGEEAAYQDLKIMRRREAVLVDALMEIKDRRKDIGSVEIMRVVRKAFDELGKLRTG